ncbi:MAG: T9SS type A sorting domain-containing protein [Bacteroidota bacterium]
MKKTLLTGTFLLAALFSANAQEIFSKDFTTTDGLEDWFILDADGDGFNWGINTAGNANTLANGFEGGVAFSNSYSNADGALTPDNSLISEAFTITTAGYTTFKIGAQDILFPAEHYAVYVVNDAELTAVLDGLEDQTTTIEDYYALLVDPILEETLDTGIASQRSLSLTSYAGESVRLVFRHYDVTDQFILLLDDIVVTEGVMGVNPTLANKFSVSPNPANNLVTIANADNMLVNAVSVTDMNGRVVKTASFDGVAQAQVNVSDLANGVYMMTISSDKGSVTKKIVKN